MRRYFYALSPLLVLFLATFLAGAVAHLIVTIVDEGLSFRTLMKKLSQLILVLSIFPLMRLLNFSLNDLGIAPRVIFSKQLIQGAAIGLISLLPVFFLLYLLGVNIIDSNQPWTMGWISKKLLLHLSLALLIAFFEEPLFRGILVAGLTRKFPVAATVLISALYYAILHFLNSNIEIPAQDTSLLSGFILLQDAINHLFNLKIFPAFLALFAVGIFLGLIRTRLPSSLGLCIGCHASWVWQIKMSKSLFNTNPHSNYLFLVSSYDGVIGPLVTIWLVITLSGYLIYKRHYSRCV
jgi:membrane protease YdiL (CAAX protease family)